MFRKLGIITVVFVTVWSSAVLAADLSERFKFDDNALFKEHNVTFAVTFGNHDSEKKGEEFWTREEQYKLLQKMGGELFVDYDIPELTGTGNGVIPISSGNKGGCFNLFVMDSGDYGPGGYKESGYDGVLPRLQL